MLRPTVGYMCSTYIYSHDHKKVSTEVYECTAPI